MRIVRLLALGLAVAGLLGGCALFGGGQSAEAGVRQSLAKWEAGAKAEDVDAIMAVYSEDYAGEQGVDKAKVRQIAQFLKDAGLLASSQIDSTKAQVVVENGAAKAAPVELTGKDGRTTPLELTFKKEKDGVWRIVAMDAEPQD